MENHERIYKQRSHNFLYHVIFRVSKNRGIPRTIVIVLEKTGEVIEGLSEDLKPIPEAHINWAGTVTFL